MREVRIKAPESHASQIVRLARELGISRVSESSEYVHGPDTRVAVVSVEVSTPVAKRFVDALLAASFFDPATHVLTTRTLRSIVTASSVRALTEPLVEPSPDVYQDLWQFSHVTSGALGRALIGAALLGHGMITGKLLYMAAGLLFLPVLPVILALGLGIESRDGPIFAQGLKTFAALMLMLLLGGVLDGALTDQAMIFSDFGEPLTAGALSFGIGVAGALATADDAGRREMIGLATASQVAIVPVWLGTALVRGELEPLRSRSLTFGISILTLIVASSLTYAMLRVRERVLHGTAARMSERR